MTKKKLAPKGLGEIARVGNLYDGKKVIHAPVNGWKPHTLYLVLVSWNKNNPLHHAYSGEIRRLKWPQSHPHNRNCHRLELPLFGKEFDNMTDGIVPHEAEVDIHFIKQRS